MSITFNTSSSSPTSSTTMKVNKKIRAKAVTSTVVQPQEAKIYPWWHNVIAGATAGAGARLFTAPLDLLKIRRQLQTTTPATASVGASPGLFHSLKRIVKTEGGIQSLFRGNLAATYLWIGYAAVQFSLYARTADYLSSFPPNLQMNYLPLPIQKPAQFASGLLSSIGSNPTAVAFCAGASAGTAATLATYPFDICRTAFASQKTLSQGTKSISTFFQLAMKDNPHPLRTIFAGSGPAVLGIVPYMGLNFALYDYLVRRGDKVKVSDAGTAGAISGGVSKFVVYPLDTVKKRLQAQSFDTFWGSRDILSKRVPYKNMIDCGSRIMREEGLGAFYRGLVPTVMKTMVATSLTFAIFQMTKNNLENFHDWKTGLQQGVQEGSDEAASEEKRR